MSSQFQPARSDQAGFNIKEFIFKYLRYLPLFLLSVLLAMTVAFIYLRYSTPVYRSSSLLFLKDDKGKGGASDRFQELFVDDRTKNIQSEIEYLKSRALMERVVEGLNINLSYYTKGSVKEQNVYKSAPFRLVPVEMRDSVPFSISIDLKGPKSFTIGGSNKKYAFGQNFNLPAGIFKLIKVDEFSAVKAYTVSWGRTSQIVSSILPSLTIAPKSVNSGILNLTLTSPNATLAADILNRLMQEYQIATIEDKNTTTQQTLAFLNGRLNVVQRELDSITRVLVNYQASNGMGDLEVFSGMLYQKAQESDREKVDMRIEQEKASNIIAYMSNARNNFESVPISFGISDATLNGLIANYNTTQLQRKSLLDANTPVENPRVRQVEDQLEKLRTTILENLRQLRNSYSRSLTDASRINSSVEAQLRSLPVKQQILIEIRRQQASKLAIFEFLNEKKEESSISLAATISNVKVLEKAVPNETPVSPNKKNVYSIAFIIGLLLPAAFVFIKNMLDDKIMVRNDIEKLTDVTILGEVGHATDNQTLVVTSGNRSYIAEQFRIIRSNLQFVLTNTSKPVILVTSSFSGEGKSFISTNIGAVMAVAGKKTIILEFDIRKPKILSGLNMSKKPGLTNYLLGKTEIESLPVPVEGIEDLYVLPCGPIPPNPAELLLDEKMKLVFAYLREKFDVVIMDTPPVGMVGDAVTLSSFADCSLYIVRQGITHKKQIELLDEFHREQKLPKMNIILNDVKIMAGYGYYGYGRYGYGYGKSYGYGYFEDDNEKESMLRKWFGLNGTSKKKKRKNKANS